MKTKINQVNLTKYLPFFTSLTKKGYALVICNYIGKPLLSELSNELVNNDSFTLQEITKKINWDEIDDYLHIPNVGYFFFSSLTLGANEDSFWLFGFQKTEQTLSQQEIAQQSIQFQHITNCLAEDFNQTEAITGMADELSVRYEELNLLYSIDALRLIL